MEYEKDAKAIYRQSFAMIRSEVSFENITSTLERTIVRMIHACGQTDLAQDVASSRGAAEIGAAALASGASILCDSNMVSAGITRSRLPKQNAILCTLSDPAVPALAARLGTTRSAAAVELWRDHLAGSVVTIANAPTALFALLDMIALGAAKPAIILGFPVGFVGAAESKLVLAQNTMELPFITVHGRRGGSAIAAAAVNALATEVE